MKEKLDYALDIIFIIVMLLIIPLGFCIGELYLFLFHPDYKMAFWLVKLLEFFSFIIGE